MNSQTSPSSKPKPSSKATSKVKAEKKGTVSKKKSKQQDDDLPLMKLYKRSKKATKKNAKKSDKSEAVIATASKRSPKPEKESTHECINQYLDGKQPAKVDQENSCAPRLPKKQKFNELDESSLASNVVLQKNVHLTNNVDHPSNMSKGPHGDLLGLLFSTEGCSSKVQSLTSKEAIQGNYSSKSSVDLGPAGDGEMTDVSKSDVKLGSAKDGNTSEVSRTSSILDDADDDELSAAGVLLGLGK